MRAASASTVGYMVDGSVGGSPRVMGAGNYYLTPFNTGTGWVVFTVYQYVQAGTGQPYMCFRNWNGRTANFVGANTSTTWIARATGGGCGPDELWAYACYNTEAILWLIDNPGAGYLVHHGDALVMGGPWHMGAFAADGFYIDGLCGRP